MNHQLRNHLLTFLLIVSFIFSGCTPTPVPNASLPTNSPIPATVSPTPAPTTVPLHEIKLEKGKLYFTIVGRQGFLFARNMAGYKPEQYMELLDLTRSGGSQLVRIQLDSMGTGMSNNGEIDEAWAKNWEKVFDKAEANGIHILPVFSGWFDWNSGEGYSTWRDNTFNATHGGPAESPTELLKKDSSTQKMWLAWMGKLVQHWQGRKNILAWEIFSEVNLITGATEAPSVEFIESAAAVIHENDPFLRPITVSMAEIDEWPSFYKSHAIDFINIHPYPPSAQLDRFALERVRHMLAAYNKPVIIGESGLNAESPEKYPPKAEIGVRHAIWAEIVSGAANARALYWEDSFGIFFPTLDWPWVRKYAQMELPARKFVEGIDFSNFKPLAVGFPADTKIWGAAIGSEKSVVGWFRDAQCEPPNWPLEPVITGQNVTIATPGSTAEWNVDFYDTKTGADILASATVTNQDGKITIKLPDFQDDIAFKMTAVGGVAVIPTPVTSTDSIAGKWAGAISNIAKTFSTQVKLEIQPGCQPGTVCGKFSAPKLSCAGELFLEKIDGETFVFIEQNVTGAATCTSGGYETLQLQPDGTLSYRFSFAPEAAVTSQGLLKHP